jgi:hypothetical protein
MGIDKSQLKFGRAATDSGSSDYTDLRQGFSRDIVAQNKYMTGIYGYQKGYASFGIMENGTAFFGRADRGGRIIIDGYNATIYGGANGMLEDPTIGDPMWNCMRLTFVDLTHSTSAGYNPGDQYDTTRYNNVVNPNGSAGLPNNIVATEVDGVKQGFDGKFFGMGDFKSNAAFADANFNTGRATDDFPWWY